MPIPTFTSPRTGTIPVVNAPVHAFFSVLSPAEQSNYCSIYQRFRLEVESRGDDTEYLRDIGVTATAGDVARVKGMILDTCDWQISCALKYSTPTRIAEAAPYIERVIAKFAIEKPGQVDVTPEMYLGVALHKVPGQEDAAISHFQAAYTASPAIEMQSNTQLWSRACFSRLLRRIGRISEAEEQEDTIRDWLQWHPFGMSPSEFCATVKDPEHEGRDYILEHPLVEDMFAGQIELGPGIFVVGL